MEPPSKTPDPQRGSRLMLLPQELRDEIFARVFLATRLRSGLTFAKFERDRSRILPGPHSLALLRVCRRIRQEIGTSWLGQVLFAFEDWRAMVDKLARLSVATRRQIRYVRVVGHEVRFRRRFAAPGELVLVTQYAPAAFLPLLPGLHLDRLIVVARFPFDDAYDTFDGLVSHTDGWRELCFLTPDARFLDLGTSVPIEGAAADSAASWSQRPARPRQPAGWQKALERRDGAGAESGASVTISLTPLWMSPLASLLRSRALMRPDLRTPFAQPPLPAVAGPKEEEDPDTSSGDDDNDRPLRQSRRLVVGDRDNVYRYEILVVARRGRNADYEIRDDEDALLPWRPRPPRPFDIRMLVPPRTPWETRVRAAMALVYEVDDRGAHNNHAPEAGAHPVLRDAYNYVDEHAWWYDVYFSHNRTSRLLVPEPVLSSEASFMHVY